MFSRYTKLSTHFSHRPFFLHLVWKCVLVIQTQVDSHDTSLFPPVFVMCPTDHLCSGFNTAYVSLPLDGQRALCFWMSKATTHPVLITCFPVSSLSGTHQAALAFTLQKTFSHHRPHLCKWFEWSDINVSWWFLYLASSSCDLIAQDAF